MDVNLKDFVLLDCPNTMSERKRRALIGATFSGAIHEYPPFLFTGVISMIQPREKSRAKASCWQNVYVSRMRIRFLEDQMYDVD